MDLQQLIEDCQKGRRQSQEALYREYAKQMYAVCLLYTHNKETASDIMHDAFIKVFKNIKQFKGGKFEAWLRTVIVNTAIDHLRKQKKMLMDDVELQDSAVFAHDGVNDGAHASDLNDIIGTLPVGARTIFDMYTVQGYNHREIAAKLGISEGTSKSQYSRARGMLKELIEKHF